MFGKDNTDAVERKRKNNEKISKMGIPICETLPVLDDKIKKHFKSLDEICKRAITSFFSVQLACDLNHGANYQQSRSFFLGLLNTYHVQDYLILEEKNLFNGNCTQKDIINMTWSYECYWSLVWALGLVDNREFVPNRICDCNKAIQLVKESKTYEDFKNKCHLRDLDEILDALDLHYRYHWACVEKRINPNTFIGDLNPDVVFERRRGLEWLFSEKEDWYDISLDT